MQAAAFAELVQRHAGWTRRIASACGRDADDRDDVVQQIVLQLWRCRERLLPIEAHAAALAVAVAEPDDRVERLLACIAELGPIDRRARHEAQGERPWRRTN